MYVEVTKAIRGGAKCCICKSNIDKGSVYIRITAYRSGGCIHATCMEMLLSLFHREGGEGVHVKGVQT